MANLTLKTGDTYPPLQATLTDGAGTALDLTDASTITVILSGQQTKATIVGTCTIVDATAGTVKYSWAANDTQMADTYGCEFHIVWAAGGIQTVPNAAAANPTVEIDATLDGSVG